MMEIAKSAKIFEPVSIIEEHDVKIGERCRIGQFCFIAARKFVMKDEAELCPQVTISGGGDVEIGERATICYGVRIIPATFSVKGVYMNDAIHQRLPEMTELIRGSITIGEGAYIGSNAVICITEKNPHIKIGEFSVIGALSYIDKDVPPKTIMYPYQTLHIKERIP
jgi:acetyltransferase-like isoleucine patch superfamily enzyme